MLKSIIFFLSCKFKNKFSISDKMVHEVKKMGKRKFFFFDIDGTLAVGTPGDQYVPESTKLALRKLEEQGHFLAIATRCV